MAPGTDPQINSQFQRAADCAQEAPAWRLAAALDLIEHIPRAAGQFGEFALVQASRLTRGREQLPLPRRQRDRGGVLHGVVVFLQKPAAPAV